jgi:addiction module HigA family antidote
MFESFGKYKGIHPGAVIGRELEKKKLSQRSFAQSLPEHPQTINALLKGNRDLNTSLALKIEKALGIEEGALLMLQSFYDIAKEKKKMAQLHRPDLRLIRRTLFWDTDINAINWEKQARPVIKRIFQRGNLTEKKEITRFYGSPKVRAAITPAPARRRNAGPTS